MTHRHRQPEIAMCNPRITQLLNRVDLLLQALALAAWFYLIFLMAIGHPIPPVHGTGTF